MPLPCKLLVLLSILFLPDSSSYEYAPVEFTRVDWCRAASCSGTPEPIRHSCCNVTRKMSHTEIFTDHVEFRRNVVHWHNVLRDKVAAGSLRTQSGESYPPSGNMRALSYSLELEYVARCWIVRIDGERDACRRTPTVAEVGQNWLFLSRLAPPNKWHLYPWWIEHRDYHPKYVDNYTDPEHLVRKREQSSVNLTVSRFVQLIWAETTHIGCARSWNPRNYEGKNYAFVCNYAPGSVRGTPVYKPGFPLSVCGYDARNKHYTNLCGASEPIPTNKPLKIHVQLKKETEELQFEDMEVKIPEEWYLEPTMSRGGTDGGAGGIVGFLIGVLVSL